MAASLLVQGAPTQGGWGRSRLFVCSSETFPPGRFPKVPGIRASSCLLCVFLQISLVVQWNSGTMKAAAIHPPEPSTAAPGPTAWPAREGTCSKTQGETKALHCPSCTEVMAKARSCLGKDKEGKIPKNPKNQAKRDISQCHPRRGTTSAPFRLFLAMGRFGSGKVLLNNHLPSYLPHPIYPIFVQLLLHQHSPQTHQPCTPLIHWL